MIASGLGDLYSKPVSNADWRLSHRLLGTEHSPIVMEIVNAAGGLLEGVAPQLPGRDPDAVAKLTASIMLSGLGMQAAGSSGPASGGEHLVSHYIDMTAIAFGEPHDFHGCQVAVGTCATISLYDELRGARPEDFDLDRLVGAHPEWPDYEPVLRTRFEGLEDAVLSHARKMYPTRDDVAARLTAIFDSWDDLFRDVGETLRPPAELRAELESAECPVRFDQIGVTPERAFRAVAWSKDIRARYTVLHLASELGVLDDFAKRYTSD
jgi:glycerol-1-phosphate dehydrogenase [NAD(P)+]